MSRDGLELQGLGIVRIINGEVCIDHRRVAADLVQFEGRYCEYVFRFPDKSYPIDSGILPLVEALNAIGIATYYSCEGHMEERYGELKRYPYVVFIGDAVKLFPQHLLGDVWMLEDAGEMACLRPKSEAGSTAELAVLQKEAIELAAQIRSLAR